MCSVEKPLVSVIVPTFNRGDKIIKSIESILRQSYSNLECVIVDDGSTDNTEEAISNIEDRRIIYIKYENNMGPSYARNIGIKACKGEIIAFNDSDDVWCSNKLEVQLRKLEKCDACFCRYRMKTKDGQFRVIPDDRYKPTNINSNLLQCLMYGNLIGAPTLALKTKCLDKVGIFDEDLFALEDYDFAIRLAKECNVKYYDDVLVDVYATEGSVSSNFNNARKALRRIILKNGSEDIRDLLGLYNLYFEHYGYDWEGICHYSDEAREIIIHRDKKDQLAIQNIYDSVEKRLISNFRYRVLLECTKIDLGIKEIPIKYLNESVLIYGYGVIGRKLEKVLSSKGVRVVGFIDREDYNINRVFAIANCTKADLIIISLHPSMCSNHELEERTGMKAVNIMQIIEGE